jgi:hypothetical protein
MHAVPVLLCVAAALAATHAQFCVEEFTDSDCTVPRQDSTRDCYMNDGPHCLSLFSFEADGSTLVAKTYSTEECNGTLMRVRVCMVVLC